MVLESAQLVAEPYAPYTAWGDEDSTFPQFIAGPYLPMGRLLDGIINISRFGRFFDSVLYVGFMTAFIDEGVNATVFHGSLVSVEGISGQAHDLAGS
jgi:hypothetical protein